MACYTTGCWLSERKRSLHMVEREGPEPPITGPENNDLDREAQPLGDGVEKNQLHPPKVGLEMFVEKLRSHKDQLLQQVNEFLHKPNKTREEIALGIYVDVVLKQHIFGIDPFASKNPGDDELQTDREMIAYMAGEYVAHRWLDKHPESQAAEVVARYSIYAPSTSHESLVQEIWPSLWECKDRNC